MSACIACLRDGALPVTVDVMSQKVGGDYCERCALDIGHAIIPMLTAFFKSFNDARFAATLEERVS